MKLAGALVLHAVAVSLVVFVCKAEQVEGWHFVVLIGIIALSFAMGYGRVRSLRVQYRDSLKLDAEVDTKAK